MLGTRHGRAVYGILPVTRWFNRSDRRGSQMEPLPARRAMPNRASIFPSLSFSSPPPLPPLLLLLSFSLAFTHFAGSCGLVTLSRAILRFGEPLALPLREGDLTGCIVYPENYIRVCTARVDSAPLFQDFS